MKSPLTRRRERRILAALHALGPLNDYELSDFLGTPSIFLTKPLMNLACDKKIKGTRQISLLLPGCFIWSVTDQTPTNGSDR